VTLPDDGFQLTLLDRSIPATTGGMDLVHKALDHCWTTLESNRTLEPDWCSAFTLAVAEVAANIIQYAYPSGIPRRRFTLTVWSESNRLKARLEDAGASVAWPDGHLLAVKLPRDPFSQRGRGLAIIRLTTDRFEYQRTDDGKNRWLIEKRFPD
jgi:anti-sigma regulatory factor (Ser/Thr protein kinase)